MDFNNPMANPYAQGGPMFGQGYGTGRQTLPNGPPPMPEIPQNWNAAPAPTASKSSSGMTGYDLRSVGRAIQSATQGTDAPTPLPQYTSGIEAGPVWNPAQMARAANAIAGQRSYMPQNVSGVGMAGDSQRLMDDLARQNGSTDALAFLRAGAKTNADQLYNSQSARANSGVQGGNWLANLNQNNLTNQAAYNSTLMNIIGSLLGSL